MNNNLRYIFYILAIVNILGAIFIDKSIGGALGWICAIIYCYLYYDVICVEDENE